jgi:hypothetical protein
LSSRQINNSHLLDKVALRIEALGEVSGNSVEVLDAFCGDRVLWQKVQDSTDRELSVFGIDKENEHANIKADNRKILGVMDLSPFQIIDLDAYGLPFEQIEKVFGNDSLAKGAVIVYTYISLPVGGASERLLQTIGIPHHMWGKCPSMFMKAQESAFYEYLRQHGIDSVKEVRLVDTGHGYRIKRYGYFKIPE